MSKTNKEQREFNRLCKSFIILYGRIINKEEYDLNIRQLCAEWSIDYLEKIMTNPFFHKLNRIQIAKLWKMCGAIVEDEDVCEQDKIDLWGLQQQLQQILCKKLDEVVF